MNKGNGTDTALKEANGKKRADRRLLGNLLLLLTAMIWGTAFVFQRVGMENIEPFTFTSARSVLSFIVVFPVLLVTSRQAAAKAPARKDEAWLKERREVRRHTLIGGLVCGTFLSIASLFQQVGMVETSAGKSGFITAMYMLIVPVVSAVVFRKKHPLLVWIAVAAGVAGLYLLCVTDSLTFVKSDILVFMCAVFFSGQILSVDHFVRRGDPVMLSLIQFLTTAVIAGVLALIAEHPTKEKLIAAAIPILYCGVMSGGVGYTLQIVAQKFTEPTVASLLMSLESVFAVSAGALILGEKMTRREGIGCFVMFIAIILVQIPDFFHFRIDIPPSGSCIKPVEADKKSVCGGRREPSDEDQDR